MTTLTVEKAETKGLSVRRIIVVPGSYQEVRGDVRFRGEVSQTVSGVTLCHVCVLAAHAERGRALLSNR